MRCTPIGLNSKFLAYVLDGLPARRYFYTTAKQTTNLAASATSKFGVPAISEQTKIADYLDHETSELHAAIADSREAIALSRERRAALISAAVTGRVDVRGEV